MRSLTICIGSACHIKGSHEVIDIFQKLILEYSLEEKIELNGSFCLKKCTDAVSVQRWDNKILSVSKENARCIFEDEIIPYI